MTVQEILDMLERRALHCEAIASKEDKKRPASKLMHKIVGCHMAARQLREAAEEIQQKEDIDDWIRESA